MRRQQQPAGVSFFPNSWHPDIRAFALTCIINIVQNHMFQKYAAALVHYCNSGTNPQALQEKAMYHATVQAVIALSM
jgi:hypothetical protein